MSECELPAAPGAHVLLIRLDRPLARTIGRLGPVCLAAGLYGYCGSARGPGGIRARVRRHLRREKAIRWHVDHLTGAAAGIRAIAKPGGDECALARRLLALDRVAVPVAGFGSSDCRSCPAHLLRLPAGLELSFL